MVNFGYNKYCEGWKGEKRHELVERLKELMRSKGYCTDFSDPKREGFTPYLETNDPYDGVRIRAITHLSEEQQDKLVKVAEEIYAEVMGLGEKK